MRVLRQLFWRARAPTVGIDEDRVEQYLGRSSAPLHSVESSLLDHSEARGAHGR